MVEKFVSEYMKDAEFSVVKIQVKDFPSAVSEIKEQLRRASEEVDETILNLSGEDESSNPGNPLSSPHRTS